MPRTRISSRASRSELVLAEYTVGSNEDVFIEPDVDWSVPDLIVTIERTMNDPATGFNRSSLSTHVSDCECPEGDGIVNRTLIVQHMIDVHGWTPARAGLVLGKTGVPGWNCRVPAGVRLLVVIRLNKPAPLGAFRTTTAR